jgi:S-adenosylmethionine:diacylglycerol 3-amino-3-carboxypropyl transferase
MTMGSPSATPTVRTQLGGAVQQNKALSVTGILERAFAQTFTGLVYPQIWEDPVVDMDALAIGSDDAIIAIASGRLQRDELSDGEPGFGRSRRPFARPTLRSTG